jgi:hypothetical protein
VTNEPTSAPPPESEKPPAERTDQVAADAIADEDPREPFVMRFPRAPIPGTELAVRAPSFGQHAETAADSRNEELDDRAFVARLVTRQLDTGLPADEVEAWPDERLIAAGQGYLSLTAREPDQDDGDADDDSGAGETESQEAAPIHEPDTSTFAGIRAAIRRDDERRSRKMRKLFEGIGSLADSNAAKLKDLVKVNPDMVKAMDSFKGLDVGKLTGADAFRNLGMAKSLDAFKGIDLAQLSGTNKIAESIAKLTADTAAMEQFAGAKFKLPEIPTSIPREPMTYIGPLVNPEVRLLEEVTETLERMHDDELRTAEGQIEVLVEVTTLLKKQGLALEVLVNDARGQKWPRRAILATAVIAAVAAVLAVAYSAGTLRPFDAAPAVSASSPTPVVSPSTAPSPTSAPTITPKATLSASPSPPPASPAAP